MSIHAAENDIISFFLWLIFYCLYVPHLLYSSVDSCSFSVLLSKVSFGEIWIHWEVENIISSLFLILITC